MQPPVSDDAGWRVATTAVGELGDRLGARLISAYVIGSLAHGGFAPAVSDIDVAVLVDLCTAEIPALVADATAATRARLGGELAGRLSVFYGDWPTFAAPAPPARLGAIDRLDLMAHGRLVAGVDRRASGGRTPSRVELVAATAAFLADRPPAAADPVVLVDEGPRALTKAVLFPVRFLYTAATGAAGSNRDAARWYCAAARPSAPLVDAALAWRGGSVAREEAIALVAAYLPILQQECRRAFAS